VELCDCRLSFRETESSALSQAKLSKRFQSFGRNLPPILLDSIYFI
jgi:hypothetical protein